MAWVLVGAPCLRTVGKVAWEPSRGLFPTAQARGDRSTTVPCRGVPAPQQRPCPTNGILAPW